MVRARTARFPVTLVEVTPDEYVGFSEPVSAFDGSNILTKSIGELVSKLRAGNLRLKDDMSAQLVDKLRDAVIASPTVDRKTKALLSRQHKSSFQNESRPPSSRWAG
jgi:hypothetical protein